MNLSPSLWSVLCVATCSESLAAQTFTSHVMAPSLGQVFDVIAADLDGDGFQDGIVSSVSDRSVTWFKGSPLGPAGPPTIVYDGGSWKSELDAADMDGDGDIDVVSITTFGNSLNLHENLGAGIFASEVVLSSDHQRPHALVISDIDDDEILDVLVSSTFDDRVTWYRGLGSLVFAPGADLPGTKPRPKDAFPIDLDSDGDVDVLYASSGSDEIGWYENIGGGAFQPAATIATGISNAGQIRPGDLDDDGDLDLVATSIDDGIVRVFLQDGMSFVMQPPLVTGAGGITELKLVDLNGDRQLDLLLSSNFALHAIQLCVGRSDGTFAPAVAVHAEVGATYGVFAADLDGDGDKDIMHANYSSGIHFWLRNDLTSYGGVGVRTCWPAELNATGQPATLAAIGSVVLADDDLRLQASGMSPHSAGYFITSRTENEEFPVASSAGRLCIGPSIGRQVGGLILSSGASGTFGVNVDFAAMPTPAGPVAVLPGDSWSMQAWFRDAGPVPTSNFSDAIRLQFE